MKTFNSIVSALAVCILICSCSDKEEHNNTSSSNEVFASQEEAVLKAKSDLIQVIRSAPEVHLNLNAEQLDKAQPAKVIRQVEIDFDRLLQADDSSKNLMQLVKGEKNNIVPLQDGNTVVTVILTHKLANGWGISGLASAQLSSEINAVYNSIGGSNAEITVYEIPNLHLSVYGVKRNGQEEYMVDFNQFTLREPQPISRLLPELKRAALEFEKNYGSEVKANKLVK
jgi:hypothetical protein